MALDRQDYPAMLVSLGLPLRALGGVGRVLGFEEGEGEERGYYLLMWLCVETAATPAGAGGGHS